MIELAKGNLLQAPVEALVNTVNTVGIMGRGIALQFKQAYPRMFRAYEAACKAGDLQTGKMHVFDLGGLAGSPRWIVNFPTKGHWRAKSRIEDIEAGLVDLVATIKRLGISSIAVPPLGCGNGGLDWDEVRPRIEAALAEVPSVRVLLYPPGAAPEANAMPNRTARPAMTMGRAALIVLMDRYLKGLLDPVVTLLELHKLMYFLQEAGQPLKLEYQAGPYGPYAPTLRQVLIRLDSHFIVGYGDGKDSPTKPIQLAAGAVEAATEFLRSDASTQARMNRVAALIAGFEDPYGLELLSTVHWVMRNNPAARHEAPVAIDAVQKWSPRKQQHLKREHLMRAWERLKAQGWDQPAAGFTRRDSDFGDRETRA
jgi:O-acetyl-ADP-ribose deacetylase (regulator of RNase III)